MKYLLLVKGLSYVFKEVNGKLIHFQSNAPREVEDSVADILLPSGKFREIPLEELFVVGDSEISVKFSGTIGDAVVTANCMASLLKKGFTVVGIVPHDYRAIITKIAPGLELRDFRYGGRGLKHINMAIARRTPGEGFAWENGIASALSLKRYPAPSFKISFSQFELFKYQMLFPGKADSKKAVLHLWSEHSRSKSYDPEKVPELVRGLKDMGFDSVLIGGKNEPKYKVECFDLRGKCSLVESAAVLSQADVVISVDSWVWHMTKLLYKPQVVLFGSLRCDGEAQPWEKVRVLRGQLCPGKDCNIYSCRKSKCIDSIKVEDIISSVKKLTFVSKEVVLC